MRLISEDDVLALLTNHHFDNDKGNFDLLIHNLCKEVRRIPTVYDPDKVVDQLNDQFRVVRTDADLEWNRAMDEAITIVNGDGLYLESTVKKVEVNEPNIEY